MHVPGGGNDVWAHELVERHVADAPYTDHDMGHAVLTP